MIDLITAILMISVLGSVALYMYYILIMTLRNKFGITWWVMLLGAGFLLFDAFVNIFIVSVLYFERPHEWLVTDRLHRWCEHYEFVLLERPLKWYEVWRFKTARVVCDHPEYGLDKFDPLGSHCCHEGDVKTVKDYFA